MFSLCNLRIRSLHQLCDKGMQATVLLTRFVGKDSALGLGKA